MTAEECNEIAALAAAEHAASDRFRWLGMSNHETDPMKARQQAVAYRVAETEWLIARQRLAEAQAQIAKRHAADAPGCGAGSPADGDGRHAAAPGSGGGDVSRETSVTHPSG